MQETNCKSCQKGKRGKRGNGDKEESRSKKFAPHWLLRSLGYFFFVLPFFEFLHFCVFGGVNAGSNMKFQFLVVLANLGVRALRLGDFS